MVCLIFLNPIVLYMLLLLLFVRNFLLFDLDHCEKRLTAHFPLCRWAKVLSYVVL